jgi:hypothetical protein
VDIVRNRAADVDVDVVAERHVRREHASGANDTSASKCDRRDRQLDAWMDERARPESVRGANRGAPLTVSGGADRDDDVCHSWWRRDVVAQALDRNAVDERFVHMVEINNEPKVDRFAVYLAREPRDFSAVSARAENRKAAGFERSRCRMHRIAG